MSYPAVHVSGKCGVVLIVGQVTLIAGDAEGWLPTNPKSGKIRICRTKCLNRFIKNYTYSVFI